MSKEQKDINVDVVQASGEVKAKGEHTGKLVCFDWDETIIKGHSHNYIVDYTTFNMNERGVQVFNGATYIPSTEETTFLTKYYSDKEKVFNNVDSIHRNIVQLIEHGCKIAIVTYNNFPWSVDYGLKKIGFNEEQLSKILIIYNFPEGEMSVVGKSEHIAKAKELYSIEDNKNVSLIDDSFGNIRVAEAEGIKCVKVTFQNTQTFMQEVMNMVGVEAVEPKEASKEKALSSENEEVLLMEFYKAKLNEEAQKFTQIKPLPFYTTSDSNSDYGRVELPKDQTEVLGDTLPNESA